MLAVPFDRREQDVLRLDVAVDDALAVRVHQPRQHLAHDGDRSRWCDLLLLAQELAQALARRELHHQVRGSVFHAEVGDRHAVRVGKAAHGARLDLEAPQAVRGGGVLLEQELDGDPAAELDALAAVDRAHRPVADPLDDPVAIVQHRPDAWVGADHRPTVSKGGRADHIPAPERARPAQPMPRTDSAAQVASTLYSRPVRRRSGKRERSRLPMRLPITRATAR